jgi:shikimate dehydrogenase
MTDRPLQPLGAHTRLVALLGHPVGHSLSPAMQNAAFATAGLDLVYLAFDVPPERLGPAVAGLRALGAVGANVTVPHKQTILPLIDALHPLAERVGAVNTIVNEGGRLVGYNTDVGGFSDALRRAWGRNARGASCLLLGAGGAARAVVAALAAEGPHAVYVYNRTAVRAAELCRAASGWGATTCRPVTADSLHDLAPSLDLIVNATSLGLDPAVKQSPLPADILSDRHLVLDLVYGPRPTPLIRQAGRRGAAAFDGREMLVGQAARAFELWTGGIAPLDAIRAEAGGEERGRS